MKQRSLQNTFGGMGSLSYIKNYPSGLQLPEVPFHFGQSSVSSSEKRLKAHIKLPTPQ